MFDGNQWGMFQIILLLLLVMMAVQMVLDGVRGYLQAF
jgi:small neutral amino acid transporter SnatA (MarC family)